ncbi:MAG: hypothetical protein PHQ98_02900 [Candidatus ainarchaeum sp.]|nr:hypothetical protein [Candidatus ainarchaeum sp.]
MKKFIIVLLILISLTSIVNAVDLNISYYDPHPAQVGEFVDVWVTITNSGSAVTDDLILKILPKDSLQLATEESVEKEIGSLKINESKLIKYKLLVSNNAVSGENEIEFLVYSKDTSSVSVSKVTSINVEESKKNIEVSVNPAVINPGNPSEVEFTLKNLTNETVSNIVVSWTESNGLILPIGSDNKKYILSILPLETKSVSYTIAADPNITTGIYPIDLTLTFNNSNGENTQESTLGIIAGGKTDFDMSYEISDSQLSISIANIGSNDAESVIVKLIKPSITNNTQIIGTLDKGDYTIANFEVSSSSVNDIELELSYTDTTGQRQTINKKITLNTISKDSNMPMNFNDVPNDSNLSQKQNFQMGQMNNRQTQSQNYFLQAGIAIMLVGIIFVGYKKRAKLKEIISTFKKRK